MSSSFISGLLSPFPFSCKTSWSGATSTSSRVVFDICGTMLVGSVWYSEASIRGGWEDFSQKRKQTFDRAALNWLDTEQYIKKFDEKLNMTNKWATDSRHMTHSGGMYWSTYFIHDTWTSEKGNVCQSVIYVACVLKIFSCLNVKDTLKHFLILLLTY